MLAKIKIDKLKTENKNPKYTVLLECPNGDQLSIEFDHSLEMGGYMPIKVHCNGISKGAKLAWYTRHVENITVDVFLETIASEIDKQYNI